MKNLINNAYPGELDDLVRSLNYSNMQQSMVLNHSQAEADRWKWLAPNKASNLKEEERRKAEVVEMLLLVLGNNMSTTGIPSNCENIQIPCDGDISDMIAPID